MNKLVRQMGLAALLATSALVPAKLAFADTPTNGGDIIVTYKDDIATLDPAIGYDWQNWSMINALFSRLVDYKPGTTELGPSLADSYDVSDDGKVYTFKLHPGVKFTNGREVTAADVKWSIERAVNPKTQGPGAGFFHSIELVTMVVVGGMASVFGSIIGAALLTVLPQLLQTFEGWEVVVFGVILMATMIFLPRGLVPSVAQRLRARSK